MERVSSSNSLFDSGTACTGAVVQRGYLSRGAGKDDGALHPIVNSYGNSKLHLIERARLGRSSTALRAVQAFR